MTTPKTKLKIEYMDGGGFLSKSFHPRARFCSEAVVLLYGDLWRCLAACRHPNSGAKTLCEEQVKTVSPARFPVIKEVSNAKKIY